MSPGTCEDINEIKRFVNIKLKNLMPLYKLLRSLSKIHFMRVFLSNKLFLNQFLFTLYIDIKY